MKTQGFKIEGRNVRKWNYRKLLPFSSMLKVPLRCNCHVKSFEVSTPVEKQRMPRLLAPLLRISLLSKRVSAGVASSLLVSLSFSAWSWSWPSRGFSDLRSLTERKTFTRKPWLRLAFNDYYFRMSQMPMQHWIHCYNKTCSKISKTLVFYSIMTRGLMMMHAGR